MTVATHPTQDNGGEPLVDAYLRRLGVGPREGSDLAYLRVLHAAHLRRVPFENLSIHLNEPISLEPRALAGKILGRGRGGFCYELNGLFAVLLEQLGYEVTLLGARVWGEGEVGPPLDHLVLRVRAGDQKAHWLVDVGFGDNNVYPLRWQEGLDQHDPGGTFRLQMTDDGDWDLYRNGSLQYRIEQNMRALGDFEAMCWYQQTSPRSHFTHSLVCSRRTAAGRVTLSGRRLIITTPEGKQEAELEDAARILDTYHRVFGIPLTRTPAIPPLSSP